MVHSVRRGRLPRVRSPQVNADIRASKGIRVSISFKDMPVWYKKDAEWSRRLYDGTTVWDYLDVEGAEKKSRSQVCLRVLDTTSDKRHYQYVLDTWSCYSNDVLYLACSALRPGMPARIPPCTNPISRVHILDHHTRPESVNSG